jgi:anti-anti-sigma regulatory factor
MTTIAAWLKIDPEHVVHALEDAGEKLDSTEGELVLDFSAVRRLDAPGLKQLEELASAADLKNVQVALRGVNIDIYKVLKLVKLTSRFSFRGQ